MVSRGDVVNAGGGPAAASPVTIRLIYRDERIVVVDKPAGLLSVPGIGEDKQDCVARRVAEMCPGALIVHRLDRETSGVLVMALDAEAHRELSRQFERRLVLKRYVAIVSGSIERDEGEIALPMRKDMEARGPRYVVDFVQGKHAMTQYRVRERLAGHTRVELSPITGRSHQLRVHLSAIGHPVLGDDIYARPEVAEMAERLLLHAESLMIIHPGTGKQMGFERGCPF